MKVLEKVVVLVVERKEEEEEEEGVPVLSFSFPRKES